VQLIVGVIGSPIAAAIAPLTQEAKVPLVITNAGGAAIPRLSPYVVRFSITIWQQAYPLGQWAAKQVWKTSFTAVSDFIPGHDAEAAFTKGDRCRPQGARLGALPDHQSGLHAVSAAHPRRQARRGLHLAPRR
jgi:hypothetical protein